MRIPDALVERIRAEYLEMPGMALSLSQVARLCGIERSLCRVLLDVLVDMKFLCMNADGAYARFTVDSMHRVGPRRS
jgi:hypothetical protein